MNKQQGFTLLEMLITIAIVVIVTTLAVPAFKNVVEGSRITSTTNGIVGAINLARSEAIKANAATQVQKLANGNWQVLDAGGVLIRQFEIGNQLTITPASTLSINYQSNGYRVIGEANQDVTVCNDDASDCRTISISTGGSVKVTH